MQPRMIPGPLPGFRKPVNSFSQFSRKSVRFFRNSDCQNVLGGDGSMFDFRRKLNPIVEGFDKAFLVEAFNRILIEETVPRNFTRGFTDFYQVNWIPLPYQIPRA